MKQGFVSVVVPVYNGASYLSATVESILTQDFEDFELLLIDDGSSDDSITIIRELAEMDSRIKPYFKDNGGVANARNFGIDHAEGEFIAFCDQDDLWLPEKLSKQMPLFQNEVVGLVYSGTVIQHENYGKTAKPGFEKKYRGSIFEQLITGNVVPSCTVVVRKRLLDQVGRFDDDRALMGVDDWHLWLKLSMVCQFDYVPDHLATHIFHGDNYSLNDEKMHAAELLCLSKIQQEESIQGIEVQWSSIISSLHARYALSYLNSADFRLAGKAFSDASRAQFSFKTALYAALLSHTPISLLRWLQSRKRRNMKETRSRDR